MTVTKKLIGRLPILLGEYDSTKAYSKRQRVTLYGSEFESKVDNNTTAPAILSNGTLTINTSNWRVVSNGTEAFLAGEKVKHFNEEDNPEFVSADTDNDGRLLESTDVNGKKTFYDDVIIKGNVTSKAIDTINDAIENKIDKIEGKSLIDENVANSLSEEDNPEYVAANLDVDNKVIDSTDVDGVITHNTRHIFKNGIEDTTGGLKKEALQYTLDNSSKLAKTLKEGGYLFSATDWSDYISNDGDKPLHLPIPELAVVNISGIDSMPTTKTQNKKAYIQYWDKQGNYFRKKIIANAQGNSSLNDPKKNIALDFFDDDWDNDTFSTKFGNWVAQGSYHLKAYYGDYFCGKAVIGYELYNEIELVDDINNDRSWKRALIPSDISENSDYDNEILFDNGARGFPAGFPVIVYLNGDFYGIFSWQIKKHRNNYHQEKKKAEQIHLDGCIDDDNVWLANGTIDWGKWNGKTKNVNNNSDGIEIREPKSLIGIDGSKYDFDTNPVELIDSTATNYDESNSNMARSSKVKQYCANLTKIIPILKQAKEEGKTVSEIKTLVSTYFDTTALVNYVIFSDVVYNGDGVNKNWQWLTYDGIKWVVEPYDLDMIMNGNNYLNGHLRTTLDIPYGWIVAYFGDELKAKYKKLRDAKIIDAKHIARLLDNWTKRIGIDNYNKELEKWPNKTKSSIYKIYEWLKTEISNMDKLYEYNN